jgi:hypothetical protein
MSRLADRMLLRCEPSRASLLLSMVDVDQFLLKDLSEEFGEQLSDAEKHEMLEQRRARFIANEPISIDKFNPASLTGVPIFAADEVALYAKTLPFGTDMSDVVATMAPPFNKFFIEFQGVPNQLDLHAWGTLVETIDDPAKIQCFEGDDGKPRWLLTFTTFMERQKGKPFGPVSHNVAGLAEDGTWFRHADGKTWWGGRLTQFEKEPPDDVTQEWGDNTAQMLFPALLTLSFLHCKNVTIENITPPTKVSRAYHKKHGRNLLRYHVLDIKPMRKVLDRFRTGRSDELRHALHICRGHFKTFTADAPLLGRATGTFWWAAQVRGSKTDGVVLKDYRVEAPSEFGKYYREADENPPQKETEVMTARDPDRAGRGLAAHAKTQNIIADVVRRLGWIPRSPSPQDPEYDLAWKVGDGLFVCEVKSILPQNEERQLRMAIGQVIRYRQKLAAAGHEPVSAVIATEHVPDDRSWDELCAKENIVLVWPDAAAERLAAAITVDNCA